jgi:hypothetical protein
MTSPGQLRLIRATCACPSNLHFCVSGLPVMRGGVLRSGVSSPDWIASVSRKPLIGMGTKCERRAVPEPGGKTIFADPCGLVFETT